MTPTDYFVSYRNIRATDGDGSNTWQETALITVQMCQNIENNTFLGLCWSNYKKHVAKSSEIDFPFSKTIISTIMTLLFWSVYKNDTDHFLISQIHI